MKKILSDSEVSQIEKIIRYTFVDKNILFEAFTHCSYANLYQIKSNERLEFLGDSVLSHIVSYYMFKKYDLLPEGNLSKMRAIIVGENNLSNIIDAMKIDKFLKTSSALKSLSNAVKCDLFEAIIGAIYLDGGIEPARQFCRIYLNPDDLKRLYLDNIDYKTELQEYFQAQKMPFEYKILNILGPSHQPEFEVGLYVNDKLEFTAKNSTIKNAQQSAAKKAYEKYKVNNK